MKAVILAGGPGTRLRRVVSDRPKSMALIAGKPFLEHQIRYLKEKGITDIIICVYYMGDKIKSYFGNGKRLGVDITYSEEEGIPLGTAGAIKNAERYIDNSFIVLNGDSHSDININKFLEFHKQKNSDFTISLVKTDKALNYGGVILEGDRIKEFLEKQVEGKGLVNSGVYLFSPKIFDYIPAGKHVSIEREIFPELARRGLLYGYQYSGYFMDIGLPETYEQFKKDLAKSLFLAEHNTIREAMQKMEKLGSNIIFVSNEQERLVGTLEEKDIRNFFLKGGNLDEALWKVLNKNPIAIKESSSKQELEELFKSGNKCLPLIDELGKVRDIKFFEEKVEEEVYPIVRGRTPLRISFAGGGTDIPYFFDKYGGVVISATIDKYCYATMVKRADKKIIIDSDLTPKIDVAVDSISNLQYDGKFDLIKSVINIMKPNFGFEIYLHNDLLPGRGLGSSASFAVLITSLLDNLMDTRYDDQKIAEIAYKAEREELGIKGGWQDQYAAVSGGFNFMEFNKDRTIIYPLRLKTKVIDELNSHLLLCYVGKSHDSGEVHNRLKSSFTQNEEEVVSNLNKLKEIAIEIKDALLSNTLEAIGRLLNESWKNKKMIAVGISNSFVDELYETGLKNGAYGGKLLGAGNGGYILFYYQPKKRNTLMKSLKEKGGEIMNFNFEFNGTKVWRAGNEF